MWRSVAAPVWLVLAVVFIIPFMAMFYPPNLRMPLFLQDAVFIWPQLVFFGPTLYLASHASAPLLSEVGSYRGTIAFWLAAALGFGVLTARLAARWLLLPLAAGFVITGGASCPLRSPPGRTAPLS